MQGSMPRWRRVPLLSAVILATGLMLAVSPGISQQQEEQPLAGVTINAGLATWTSALPVSAIYEALLEELGAQVEVKTFGSNALAYKAISLGDQDYWPNGWFPMHRVQLPDDWEGNGVLYDPHCPACGVQGYLIDSKSAEEFDVTSMMDFVGNEELKKAFDDNGDGKADLFGCPPGWGCHERIEDHLDIYEGWRDTFNHVTAAYPANFAAAQSRIEAGEPTIYYTWSPNDTVLTLVPGQRVKWLNAVDDRENMKKAEADKQLPIDALIADLGDAAVTQPALLGWPAADIRVAANQQFVQNNPAADAIFNQVVLPKVWINQATKAVKEADNAEQAAADAAAQWIADHRWLVDKWLLEARQAAGGM